LRFNVATVKNVIIDGKVVTFEVGTLDTTDESHIKALSNCKNVSEIKDTGKKSKPTS
jgi:hypothetical protein